MKAYEQLWQYFAEFFLEREIFQTEVVENIETHFMFSNPPPPENRGVY